MGSPSGSTTPVVGSDRKLLLLGADKPEGKKNLQRFDAALKEQATANRRPSDSGDAATTTAAGSPDSFVSRQRDADALATASPYASQAMNAELDADVAAAKDRIGQLDRDIDALGTSGGYVTGTLRAERDQLAADVADHDAFTNPEPADTGEDSFKDRQRDIDTIVTASPAAARAMQNELDADVAAAEDRVADLDRDIDALGTSGGYVTDALRVERDELLANLEEYRGLSSDPSGGEDWLTDAQDNLTLETQNIKGGVGIDIPLLTPAAELEIGAEVKIQQQTRGDGSVVVTTQLSGDVGLEFVDIVDIGANGRVSTQYRFDNAEDAQQFIDDLQHAAGAWWKLHPADIAFGVARVFSDYRDTNHVADVGGVELTAGFSASHNGASLNIGGAAGVTRNFTNGDTTYHASVSGGAGYDVGGGNRLAFSGSGRAALQVDANGDAQQLTITGVVNGSAPVDDLIENLGLDADGSSFDVAPGQRNSEGLAAQVTFTIDLTDAQNSAAVADLVDSVIGRGDQTFGAAAQDLLDQADVRVTLNASESGAFKADVDQFEFELGNSETELVAAWGRPPDGDFQQLA
ncbi:MAG: hypothetical protein ACR2RA_25015 [Geminicoccaceae bacterium]